MGALRQGKPCQIKTIQRMAQLRSQPKFHLSRWYYKRTAIAELNLEALSAPVPQNTEGHRPAAAELDHAQGVVGGSDAPACSAI